MGTTEHDMKKRDERDSNPETLYREPPVGARRKRDGARTLARERLR